MRTLESLPSWSLTKWREAKQKMRDFNAGTRKENLKACGLDKLEAYYKICCDDSLLTAGSQIQSELLRRDAESGTQIGAQIVQRYQKAVNGPQQTAASQATSASNAQSNAILLNWQQMVVDSILKDPTAYCNKRTASRVYTITQEVMKGASNSLDVHRALIDYAINVSYSSQIALLVMLLMAILIKSKLVADNARVLIENNFKWTQEQIHYALQLMASDAGVMKAIKDSFAHISAKPTQANKTESLEPELKETVEKHDTLNPKLFDGEHLKDEVREKILKIVDKFTEDLEEDGIRIVIKDIVLIGSNVSYNYTKDSDLDIHIIADTSSLHCPDHLYPLIYSAYRSMFNKKFDISFFGIPVELFVETEDIATISNGEYSVKDNEWIKEPDKDTIPEYDLASLNASVEDWKNRAGELISDIKTGALSGDEAHDAINEYIESIYTLRKEGLHATGEYGTENLTFKEIRNLGLLDELKDLKNEVTAKQLSLEGLEEAMEERTRRDYAQTLSRTAGTQVILQPNGHFFAYNVKDDDVDRLIAKLRRLSFVEYARRGAPGSWDFSRTMPGTLPTRYYSIEGKIKE